jgi:hypothetical protein
VAADQMSPVGKSFQFYILERFRSPQPCQFIHLQSLFRQVGEQSD